MTKNASNDVTSAVAFSSCTQYFSDMLNSDNPEILENVSLVIGNLGDSTCHAVNHLLSLGLSKPILHILHNSSPNPQQLYSLLWALRCLCGGGDRSLLSQQHEQPHCPDQPSPSIGVSDELIHLSSEFSFIASFLQHRSPEIVDVCVCCLYRLAQKNILALSHLLENNTAVHLLNLLPSLSGETTSFLIIRLLGSYLSLSQKHAQELIDINIVPVIAQLLVTTTSDDTRFGIAWIAANIALGPPSQINHLFRTGIPTSFILRSAYLNDRIIREVSFLFVGLVDNAPDKMGELVKVGLVQCLLDMVMRKDCDLVRNAMDCLVKLIRILPDERGGVLREIVEGPGMRSIVQYQNHPDQKLQHLASSIIAFTEEELG